ncbi:MAG: hypothetical protein QOE79_759 [Sphingomonadales bacterium]|nr:hypothetical protein [Sphingomonadales bacterium]MEA3050691.1 hypothetical protein [Sphingomonadales bacterium]
MVFAIVAALALAAGAEPEEPTCAVTRATIFVHHLAELPKEIRDDLVRGGRIADAGQPFTPYDVITDPSLPGRRFVLGGRSGESWFVWIDHGGMWRHYHVLGYSPVRGDREPPTLMLSADFMGEPCEAINAFFHGVMTSVIEDRAVVERPR